MIQASFPVSVPNGELISTEVQYENKTGVLHGACLCDRNHRPGARHGTHGARGFRNVHGGRAGLSAASEGIGIPAMVFLWRVGICAAGCAAGRSFPDDAKVQKGVSFLLYYGNSLWFSVGSVHLCRCTDRSSRHGVSHCLLFSWDALLRGGCGAAVSYLHCAGGLRVVRQGAGGEMRKGHWPGQDDLRLCQLPDRNRAVLCVFRIRTV